MFRLKNGDVWAIIGIALLAVIFCGRYEVKAKYKDEILRNDIAEILSNHALESSYILANEPTEEEKDRYQFKLYEAVGKIINLMKTQEKENDR